LDGLLKAAALWYPLAINQSGGVGIRQKSHEWVRHSLIYDWRSLMIC
jgi:hypothetical protein